MPAKPAPVAIDESAAKPSRKREITATVTTVAVSTVLGIVASTLIDRVAGHVGKKIHNPEKSQTTE